MEEKKNEYVLNMETNLQRLSSDETTLIFDIDKLNYVVTESAGSNTGSDGYQTKQGSTVIFSISGTSDVDVSSPGTPLDTLEELSNDFSVIGSDMRELYTKLESYYLITTFSNEWNDNFTYSVYPDNTTLKKKSALVRSSKEKRINSPAEVSLFTLLGKDIKDDKKKVFNKLINGMTFKNNRQKERFSKELNEILDELQLYYEVAYVESVKAFDSFKNEYFDKKFSQYLPYNQDKSRNFTFSKIEDSTLSNDLITLYETLNTGDKSTFNGKKRLK